MKELKTKIEHVGQEYVDEPIHKTGPVYCGKEPMVGTWIRYYKRTPLQWMKPNGRGELVPMNNGNDCKEEE